MPASSRTQTKAPESAERKTHRIESRVTASVKEVIQRASAISGMTPGDLAYAEARRVVAEHEHLLLEGADRDVFFAALIDPPEPTEALKKAFRRSRELFR
jgi:uncharacterized protein (DUF1778 family)